MSEETAESATAASGEVGRTTYPDPTPGRPAGARGGAVTRPASARTEAELKAAARRLFAERGYARTKVTDITTEAGRSAGSFYRHFTDKEDLLRALARDFEQALHQHVVEQMGHDHQLETEDEVRSHVQAYWSTYRTHLPEMVAILQASMTDEDFTALHREIRRREIDSWARHIKDAPTADRGPDAFALALAIVSMLEFTCYVQLGGGSGLEDDQVIEAITRILARGVLS